MEETTDINPLQEWFSKRWSRLKHKFALAQINTTPKITAFYTDELFITEHGKLNLYWHAEDCHYLEIDQNVGDVTNRKEIIIKLAPGVTSFTLTAYGGFNKVSKTIHIEPVSFNEGKMPLAELQPQQINMKLPKLKAKHSESKKKGRRFQQANEFETPKLVVNLPLQPQAAELEELRKQLREAFKIKEIAVLEARLQALKQTDLLDKLNDIDYNEAIVRKPPEQSN